MGDSAHRSNSGHGREIKSGSAEPHYFFADLKPGEYTCQVTVKSLITQKTALWQAPIVIEP
jgi:hypothetical protein